MTPYQQWLQSVVKNVAAAKAKHASFGAEINPVMTSGLPGSATLDEGGTGGTFTDPTEGVSLPSGSSAGNLNTNPTLGEQIQGAAETVSSPGAIGGALAGMAFGPIGSILGGALGVKAQQAFESVVNGASPETLAKNAPPTQADILPPTSVPSPAPVTNPPARNAHDAGLAHANGAAKVVTGQVPPPPAGLTPAQQAAYLQTHGVNGAPGEVQRGVLGQIPEHAQEGIKTAAGGIGVGGQLLVGGLVALGVLGAVRVFSKRKTS